MECYELERILNVVLFALGSCVAIFGIFGNIAAIWGFQKQTKKTSTSFLFQALAVADTLVLITLYSDALISNYNNWWLYNTIWKPRHASVPNELFSSLGAIAILLSNGVTVLLTFTRFVAVCFPLYTSRICSIRRVRYYLVVTIIDVISGYLPFIFGFLLHIDILTRSLYNDIFRPLVFSALPLLIITTLTIIIMVRLKIMNQRRINMTTAHRRRNKATRVLIAVNIVFLVCSLPWPLYNFFTKIGLDCFTLVASQSILFFHTVNSSVNFLIYIILSKQYRDVVIQNCRCSCFSAQSDSAPGRITARNANGGERNDANCMDTPL